jgi:hypothetical protein
VTDELYFPPLGDVDEDASVDNGDAQQILSFFASNPTTACPGLADVNLDARIDNADAQYVINYCGGITPLLPVE